MIFSVDNGTGRTVRTQNRSPAEPAVLHNHAMRIRPLAADQLADIRAIEDAAGRAFARIGMREIADNDLPTLDTLAWYQAGGRAWAALAGDDRPVGFILVDVVDGNAHVEQVSVHPGAAGHRLGAALIDHVGAWAAQCGMPALTLTTFTDVPWNGPYYERLGFRPIPDADLGPGLRGVRDEEIRRGLDRWPRTAMIREL